MDERFMDRALELAARAYGRTSPNPMVGAVVVRDGEIVGEGYHARAGEDHAEVVALRDAGESVRDATLYVTLEPCSHYGRTPPCVDAIISAGIRRVVAAMTDPNPLVAGAGFRRLKDAGIEVDVGMRQAEAGRLNEAHVKFCRTGLPFVYLKYAMSLDGKVATRTKDARWVTGEDARRRVHELRDRVDAIMVGAGTVRADDPALTTRLPDGGRDPVRIVVSTMGDLDPSARVFADDGDAPRWLAVSDGCPVERLGMFENRGVDILNCPATAQGLDLRETMRLVGERDVRTVLLEGGPTLAAAALESGIVDKIMRFIAPIVIGGMDAPSPVAGRGIERIADALRLVDVGIERVGSDVLIEGYIGRDTKCLQV
ncbi:MAG: bifunctional diaminohydroxyphosphoribosylaminopyrimidine deaminase/5-amino-6-(5-phosphoribosylamino)uracil reductase RibD [Candidatus Hydrogenedentes bacterium]|nr:bifunctional diaminohydroxyphosphoribosylaminopyrimidine deaminase/5-amino-6-(5-phosphoribosylamino)uracil reductase RibD [Candidatus Hydrogenedentota bacterium]